MEVKKLVRVTIDVELEKDVKDLVDLIANRAHTIQGVANAYSVKYEEIFDNLEEVRDEVKEEVSTAWARFKARVKGWFSRD